MEGGCTTCGEEEELGKDESEDEGEEGGEGESKADCGWASRVKRRSMSSKDSPMSAWRARRVVNVGREGDDMDDKVADESGKIKGVGDQRGAYMRRRDKNY